MSSPRRPSVGLALANLVRLHGSRASGVVVAARRGWLARRVAAAGRGSRSPRVLVASLGWWWGSARLDALDRSPLRPTSAAAARAPSSITARAARRAVRRSACSPRVRRFGTRRVDEPVQLELPLGRAPPQGARVDAARRRAAARAGRRTASTSAPGCAGRASTSSSRSTTGASIGHRGGLGGVADRLRAAGCARALAPGLAGERRALVDGVVLGDDARALARAASTASARSGLYHLLAVSGQNVVLLAAGVLGARVAARRAAGRGRISARSPRSARTCSRSGRSRP